MFVGVDLAWSRSNESGVAVLSDEVEPRVVDSGFPVEDEEIVGFVGEEVRLVAVDAPLVVPNETGQRAAEDELRPVYASYDAGPYPANREWLERVCGEVRGEVLMERLEEEGFQHNAAVDRDVRRGVIEVYPHPAMVALFGLDTVIPYKDKKGRGKEDRVEALRTYYDYLEASAIQAETLPSFTVDKDVTKAALKRFEDLLDGVFSAYIAWYLWRNAGEARVFGSESEGYITSPRLEGENIQKPLDDYND